MSLQEYSQEWGATQADLGKETGHMSPSWLLPENFEGAVGERVTRGRRQAALLSSQTHSHALHRRQAPGRSVLLPRPPGPSLTPL